MSFLKNKIYEKQSVDKEKPTCKVRILNVPFFALTIFYITY